MASPLRRTGVKFQMEDNALVECADWKQAQTLADDFSLNRLRRDLDGLARQCVPALLERFRSGHHWSLMQVEYSFDLVWRRAEKLAPVYEELSRQAILTVKTPEVAGFFGKRLAELFGGWWTPRRGGPTEFGFRFQSSPGRLPGLRARTLRRSAPDPALMVSRTETIL